jgi:hypothetical protein
MKPFAAGPLPYPLAGLGKAQPELRAALGAAAGELASDGGAAGACPACTSQ